MEESAEQQPNDEFTVHLPRRMMDAVEDLAQAESCDIHTIIADAVADHMKAKAPSFLLPDTPLKTQRALIIRVTNYLIGLAIEDPERVIRLKVVGEYLHALQRREGKWQTTAEYTANVLWYIKRRLDVMACGTRISRSDRHRIWLYTITRKLSFTVGDVRTVLVNYKGIPYRVIYDNHQPDEMRILVRTDKESVT